MTSSRDPEGIAIPPRWRLRPERLAPAIDELQVVLVDGPGFGDGRHATTYMCLQAIAALAPRGRSWRMLDFGSGSGVLSIGAVRLGATVDAVEIDPLAIDHATRNMSANGIGDGIRQCRSLEEAPGPFDLVVANILRAVLLVFATPLMDRLAPGGTLVLSGLVSTDVPALSALVGSQLADSRPEVYERGDWRTLVWRGKP